MTIYGNDTKLCCSQINTCGSDCHYCLLELESGDEERRKCSSDLPQSAGLPGSRTGH